VSNVLEALPKEVAGVRVPDSELCLKAVHYMRQLSRPVVYNHVLRTFVFGSLIAGQQGMRYDEELFFLGAALHDLGLTERFGGPERFEVAGADAAAAFLAEQGVPEDRREVVWDAVALHTSVGIASRKRPEIALVHIGAGVDVMGMGFDIIPSEAVERTLEAYPRLDFKKAFAETLIDTIKANPEAVHMTWLAPTAERHVPHFHCADFVAVMSAAPFEE
jgi:HD superfamily phosphodiesterase